MKPVYATATNITSSLGITTEAHWQAALQRRTSIKKHNDQLFGENSFSASRIEPFTWQHIHNKTASVAASLSPFEQLCLYSAQDAINNLEHSIDRSKTALILSSTKGNIEWLNQKDDKRTLLTTSATLLAQKLNIPNKPIVISHACISGVMASIYGLRLLQSGRFENVIIVGADRLTPFVMSGFQSFKAIDEEPCRPFDKERKGVNLGEAAATIILTTNENNALAQLISGATSNDANHISGPSRTGEELSMAINQALKQANIDASAIDMISAHGTATPYNDEMEAKAFTLSGVSKAALHSFKGYVGHTLGAAGVVENAMLIASLQQQQLIPSLGYKEHGVSQPLHITTESTPATIRYALKTASGFGGCNTALVWKS